MLKHSAAVSKFLEDKPNCFKLAKEMAVFSDSGRHFFRCENFFKALEAKGLVNIEMCWGSCTRGIEQNLVFLGDEATVLAQLGELKPKEVKRVPTPASVMIKMVAGRLGKLHDALRNENEQIIKSNAYAQANPQVYVRPSQPSNPDLEFSDIADGFKRFTAGWWVKKIIEEFNEVLARPEITPDVLKKAWDILSVRSVMTT